MKSIQGENMDIKELAVDLGPDGLDPILEKKAFDYGRMSWQMEWEPILSEYFGDDWTDELQAELQQKLFQLKYQSLEKANADKQAKAKVGKIW